MSHNFHQSEDHKVTFVKLSINAHKKLIEFISSDWRDYNFPQYIIVHNLCSFTTYSIQMEDFYFSLVKMRHSFKLQQTIESQTGYGESLGICRIMFYIKSHNSLFRFYSKVWGSHMPRGQPFIAQTSISQELQRLRH